MKTEFIAVTTLVALLGSAQLAMACLDHGDDPGDPMFLGGPEGSAGCSSIQGGLQLGANSNLVIDIGGYTPCTEFDRVTIGGLFTANGTLRIRLFNDFIPEPGDVFEVIRYGSRMGDFHTLANESGIAGLIVNRVFFSTHMDVTMSGLNGDTDLDGDVDFTDLLTVAQNYDQTPNATWFDGDFNNDLQVSFSDLLVVGQNYGQHLLTEDSLLAGLDSSVASGFQSDWALVQSSVSTPIPVAIPEPASLALLSPLGLLLRRRR